MKQSIIERLLIGVLLAIFVGIVLHAPFSVVTSLVWPQYDLIFKAWKEVLMLVASVLLVISLHKKQLLPRLFHDRPIQLMAVYAALHVVLLALFWQGLIPSIAGLMIDLRYLLYFVLVYGALIAYPGYRTAFIKAGIIGALIVGVFAILQVFVLPADILKYLGYSRDTITSYLTVDKNPDYVRINSTLRGPNPLGAYAGIVLALVVAAWLRGKIAYKKQPLLLTGILTLGGVVALWASYSRSALVAAVIAIGVVVALTVGRTLSRRSWIIASVILFALFGGLLAARESSFVSNVLLHENPDGGSAVSSNDEHFRSLESGTDRMIDQPFGAGIGSSGSASLYGGSPNIIENQYLFIAHETGWLGLALFTVIYALVMIRLWQRRTDWLALGIFASGVGLALIGILLPVWVDDTVSIIWWGLAAVALASRRQV